MKPNFYTLMVLTIVLPLSTPLHAQNSFNNTSPDWYNQALKRIQQLEHEIKPVITAGNFSATTIKSRTGFSIPPVGYKVTPIEHPTWEVDFQLKGIGRSHIQWTPDQPCTIVHVANELSYQYNNVTIQYINNSESLRQNFLVNKRMPGDGALTVTISPATGLRPRLPGSNSLAKTLQPNTAVAGAAYAILPDKNL